MKPITELTDLEADQRLTELLGGCFHKFVRHPTERTDCGPRVYCSYCDVDCFDVDENEPFATSYDCIIPVIQGMKPYQRNNFDSNFWGHNINVFIDATPRQLLNAVIEVLESQ